MFFQPSHEGAASSKVSAQAGSSQDPPLTSSGFSQGEGKAQDSPQCHQVGDTEDTKSSCQQDQTQGFLIQVPAGLLGQVGQTDRQRQSWELQKSHVWLLFHFY